MEEGVVARMDMVEIRLYNSPVLLIQNRYEKVFIEFKSTRKLKRE